MKFSSKLKDLEQIKELLLQEEWVLSASIIEVVHVGDCNDEHTTEHLKVKPKKGRSIHIHKIWETIKIERADGKTKKLIVEFFDRHGYQLL